MKRALSIVSAFAVAIGSLAVSAAGTQSKIFIDGKEADLKNVLLVEGKTFVEAEELIGAIGAESEAGIDKTSVEKNGVTAVEELYTVDGKDYLPLRDLAESLGGTVYWEALTGNISVDLEPTEEGVFNKHYYTVSQGEKQLAVVDGGLVLAENPEEAAAQWFLEKKSDGFYSFTNRGNGNSPDVPNGQTDSGVKLIQYSANNNDNQRFALEKKDGVWYVKVKHSELYLTADGEGSITQEEFTGEENQRFVFTYAGRTEKAVHGADAALKIPEKTPLDDKHIYKAEGLGDNVTVVKKSGGFVDIIGAKTISDVMPSWNGDGSYSLLSKEDGESVGSYVFEITGEAERQEYKKPPIHKKYVTIEKDGKYLSITDDGLCFSDKEDWWQFLYAGDGFYAITEKETGKSLDVPSASEEVGVELITYAAGSGDNQRFEALIDSGDKYTFNVKHSGLALAEKDGKLIQTSAEEASVFTLKSVGDSDVLTMGVTAMPFLIEDEEYVTNIKVQWNEVSGAEFYNVYRREGKGDYEFLESLEGLCVDDYGLKIGESYSYCVEAVSDGFLLDSAESEAVETYQLPNIEFNEFSNLKASGLNRPNTLTDGKTYFSLSHKGREDGAGGFGSMVLRTSEDDITYGDEFEVLSFEDIVSSPSTEGDDIEYCGFESIHYVYNKETGMLYMWAHMEANGGYGYARVAVAYGKPGERFKFNCFRPEGDDSRDMGIYVDDDNTAYIICAIHNNADLAIYRLTEDWTDVERRSCIVNYGKWRELPSVLKKDGIYYLFHSGTAGWYPTQGGYNTATNFEGPWSEMRTIGNTNTFSSQSGGVSHLTEGSDNTLMISYRWMWWWQDATNRITQNRLMPITISNGYAFFDYFDRFYYNLEEDLLIPIQKGKILSQGKPITATNRNEWASDANDGNYMTEWVAENEWPQSVTINLEQVYDLSEMQISWRSYNGSEPYYSYTVETSLDGKEWETVLDKSEGFTDYAFTIDALSGAAQYVRVNILDTTPRSGNKDSYSPNMYEIRILGY